ncbi:MAG: Octanoyltransferase LipM [Candidatus Omnitrophica bacterium ADurb.Bin277]|nr:MAG: Octanoyltransferase LipM [Candidatus Omnitrophica bacterium ADurb.Bin277]
MNWHLLPVISAPMSFQMAFDECLFENIKKYPAAPLLRFYVSSEPWITAGFSFRNAESLRRSELVKSHPGIPAAKRITGGGCVLHGRDIVFSLVARMDSIPDLGPVKASYARIHEAVQGGFRAFGLDPRYYEDTEARGRGADCFFHPVPNDLEWKGRKVAGGAQKRSGGVLLHHESIVVPAGVSKPDMIKSLRDSFEKVFEIGITEVNLDPEIYFQAMKRLRMEARCL